MTKKNTTTGFLGISGTAAPLCKILFSPPLGTGAGSTASIFVPDQGRYDPSLSPPTNNLKKETGPMNQIMIHAVVNNTRTTAHRSPQPAQQHRPQQYPAIVTNNQRNKRAVPPMNTSQYARPS